MQKTSDPAGAGLHPRENPSLPRHPPPSCLHSVKVLANVSPPSCIHGMIGIRCAGPLLQ